MSPVLAQVRALLPTRTPTPAWSLEPAAGLERPDLRVATLVSQRLRHGFADQWRQHTLDPSGRDLDADLSRSDAVLVEIADSRIPGLDDLDDPLVARLLAAAARADLPVIVWVTGGRPPVGSAPRAAIGRLVAAARAFYVADLLDRWRELAPAAELLEPAAPARRPAAGARTDRALVVSPGAGDQVSAGPVAVVLGPALRPIAASIDVRLLDHALPARGVLPLPLSEQATTADHAALRETVARAAVLVDGPRRTPRDHWSVLEAAAAGTPVVSMRGLQAPDGLTLAAPDDARGLRAEVVARQHQPELGDREALQQRRAVLASHTFAHRARVIAGALGRQERPSAPSVSVVVSTNRPHELDTVLENLARQAYRDLELVLVLHGFEVDQAALRAQARALGIPGLVVRLASSDLTLGACLNLGVEASSGDLVAKMDDDNYYGTAYLTDLVAALRAQGAGIAGKWAHHVWLRSTGAVVVRYPDAEHQWARRIQGGSMLFEGDLVRSLRFGDLPRAVDSDILDRAIAAGVAIWSADRFNFVSVRGEDHAAHTWTVEDATFLTASGRLAFYGDPRSHVEV